MGTEVYTESVCDRCGEVVRRKGAEGDIPPVEWARFTISYRAPGPGWSGGGARVELTLCSECANAVEAFATGHDNPPQSQGAAQNGCEPSQAGYTHVCLRARE